MAQRFQQPQYAVRARRRPQQNGTHQAFAQLLCEVFEHLVARWLNILEQLLHELVVMIGERLQHGEARGLLPVE